MPPRRLKTQAEYARTSRAYKHANSIQARYILSLRKMKGYRSSLRPVVTHRFRGGVRRTRGGWQEGDRAFNQQSQAWAERLASRRDWDDLLDDAGAVGEPDQVALWQWARD